MSSRLLDQLITDVTVTKRNIYIDDLQAQSILNNIAFVYLLVGNTKAGVAHTTRSLYLHHIRTAIWAMHDRQILINNIVTRDAKPRKVSCHAQ